MSQPSAEAVVSELMSLCVLPRVALLNGRT